MARENAADLDRDSSANRPPESRDRERRCFSRRQLKVRVRAAAEGAEDGEENTDSTGSPGTLEGYAAVFNEETDLYFWREMIAPGAFAESIKEDDQRALVNHDTSLVIGRSSTDSLRCQEDKTGLRVEIDLPDTTYARDLYACVERGDIDGMSIGFLIQGEEREVAEEPGGKDL